MRAEKEKERRGGSRSGLPDLFSLAASGGRGRRGGRLVIIRPTLEQSVLLGSECQGALLPVTFRALSADEGPVRNAQIIILWLSRGMEQCVCVRGRKERQAPNFANSKGCGTHK